MVVVAEVLVVNGPVRSLSGVRPQVEVLWLVAEAPSAPVARGTAIDHDPRVEEAPADVTDSGVLAFHVEAEVVGLAPRQHVVPPTPVVFLEPAARPPESDGGARIPIQDLGRQGGPCNSRADHDVFVALGRHGACRPPGFAPGF